jgi:hypothetical protein
LKRYPFLPQAKKIQAESPVRAPQARGCARKQNNKMKISMRLPGRTVGCRRGLKKIQKSCSFFEQLSCLTLVIIK